MATTVYQAPVGHHGPTQAIDRSGSQPQADDRAVNNSHYQEAYQEPDIQLRLTSLLQTTLKIEPLFELFFGQLQHLLKVHSCHFYHQKKNIDIKLGKLATHTTDYALNLQDIYLGNIILSRKQRFTEPELIQIESLLSILVYPVRNALSYLDAIQQALSDPLTGLGNRGALEQAINHQWQMAQRYDQHFSVLMIDIDHFKQINDTYGHATGDKVLQAVAKSLNSTTRQTDLAYRYGGEEFTVILNKSQQIGAEVIAERIRENIAALTIPVDGDSHNTISVTISIGGCSSLESTNTHEMMQYADQALYYAKEHGRNRVDFFHNKTANHTQRNLLVSTKRH